MSHDSILYVQTSDAPERQYSPLVLAQTAKAMDIEETEEARELLLEIDKSEEEHKQKQEEDFCQE